MKFNDEKDRQKRNEYGFGTISKKILDKIVSHAEKINWFENATPDQYNRYVQISKNGHVPKNFFRKTKIEQDPTRTDIERHIIKNLPRLEKTYPGLSKMLSKTNDPLGTASKAISIFSNGNSLFSKKNSTLLTRSVEDRKYTIRQKNTKEDHSFNSHQSLNLKRKTLLSVDFGKLFGWDKGGFDIGVSHNITSWTLKE